MSLERLLESIELEFRQTQEYTGLDSAPAEVLAAISRVPREQFVSSQLQTTAYQNTPLPIGYRQTVSQPFIVALMTALLAVSPGDRVLEVGTGSGYQAAVLAELGAQVYSVEIIPELARRARSTLDELGYHSVKTRTADGFQGWPEEAPFDGIIVTAAPTSVPPPLLNQLAVDAHLVIPVGETEQVQTLQRYTRQADGRYTVDNLLPVRFVPFTGENLSDSAS